MRIKEVEKKLEAVEPGGVFRLKGIANTRYIKTDRERAGTATVVELKTGQMLNMYLTLTVVEID